MPVIYIDNKPYEVKAGKNLLETSLSLGFDLPYFCWHPAMGSVGACRQCAVKVFKDEQDNNGRLVMSCMESVKDGLRMSITDSTAKAFREQVIEWLMTNHPHDCPVCDEGGNCHLQDMTVMTGHDYRRFEFKKRTYTNQYLGPLIHHEMNRCIQCYRCVRFYRDYAGGDDLDVFGAHNHVYFGREQDGALQSPFSGNLVEVCPTGVFTDKTLKKHYTRKWDLTTSPSICQHCSLGCNIIAGERYGQLRCIVNRYNSNVNGYFLCDKGRYGYEFVNSVNRVTIPLIRTLPVEAVDEATVLGHLKRLVTDSPVIGIGSPRASMESNFALMQLVGKDNFYQGISEDTAYLERRMVELLQTGAVSSVSLKEIEMADVVLVLGEDIWNTAPVMALAVRQAVMKTAATQAVQQTSLAAWHDAAIKEFVQNEKGFLANITVIASPLDAVSTVAVQEAPDHIARLGFAIAHLLNAAAVPPVPGLTEQEALTAKHIAGALQGAKRPVVISGTSCYNEGIIKAAYNISLLLNRPQRKAGIAYVLPECNSMGLAMMKAPPFEAAMQSVKAANNCTVIILENDLYRHIPEGRADDFIRHCKNLIVLDVLHNRTTAQAQVLIPAASFAEADGTLVNNEGRVQHFYQVYMPANNCIKESWKWLGNIQTMKAAITNGLPHHPDEWLAALETALPQFQNIAKVTPPHSFRINGQPIPREPHRYSGRTAMLANISVSEPRPLQDNDSPLTYTMEGYPGIPPASMTPYFWMPGWNSGQAVNKYQAETGGELREQDRQVCLFQQKEQDFFHFFKDSPESFSARQGKYLLLPQYQLFGSGELSIYSTAIEELVPQACIILSAKDAAELGVVNGASVTIEKNDLHYTLPLKIHHELCSGIILAPFGYRGIPALPWGAWVKIIV
ncbi:NADH-quinone oxidoreductase subunit NuoG [Agriterribacter sp.]|uniref:NADH-quinone oxidoreductase subunit NuoG n=1 Tax=Agriterribacter sp. TaxID=2821509 RepID=UPI002CB0FADA|nr:NADH-quinone oxidoreductase subunit NuoG [Agriterribacter sp.]HTN07832.1 NADH-quinone oxidoreductase subunit NuoG [Agriterribacter sp.]